MLPVTKTTNKPHIRAIKMACDEPIGEIPHPLPDHAFSMLVVSSPGEGKTTFATSLLTKGGPYFKKFNRLIVIQPKNSRASYADDPWKNHPRVHDDLTAEVLQKILDEAKALAEDELNTCVLIDDFAYTLKDKAIERQLRELFFNRRHARISVILISQTLKSIPPSLRRTASHLVVFRPPNAVEAGIIQSEFIFVDRKQAAALWDQVFQQKYDHLLVWTASRRVFRNFDELTLPSI